MSAADRVALLECTTLELSFSDAALTILVRQPGTMNALSPAVIADLRSVITVLRETLGRPAPEGGAADWSIRGVILTGAGERAFVAGADIQALSTMNAEDVHGYAGGVHELFDWIETLPVPVIAAVNGYALGGGCELALACDMIFASENAKFGQPEVGLGVIPGFGGCVRLQRTVSPGAARDLIFTGRHITAAEAHSLGLVTQILPNISALLEAAHETIRLISQQSPTAVATAKRTMNAVQMLSTEAGVAIELDGFASRFGSPDMIEGTSAFLEKRPAEFPGA